MLITQRPAGTPFFARIRSLDLACPDCDTVYVTRPEHRTTYDRYTARFHCRNCGATFVLGVLAYRTSRYLKGRTVPVKGKKGRGRKKHQERINLTPADRTPSVAQAGQLRARLPRLAKHLGGEGPDPNPPPSGFDLHESVVELSRDFLRRASADRQLDSGGGLRMSWAARYAHGDAINRVVEGLCRCQLNDDLDGPPTIDPGCPMHSRRAKGQPG